MQNVLYCTFHSLHRRIQITSTNNGVPQKHKKAGDQLPPFLIPYSLEIFCDHILQKFLPVDVGDDVPRSIMVSDVSRIFRQNVTYNLPDRIIVLFVQSIIYLYQFLFSNCLVQLFSPHKDNTTIGTKKPNMF